MKRHKFNSQLIYLMCTSIRCSTTLTLNVKPDISIIKCGSVYRFTENIPVSTMFCVTKTSFESYKRSFRFRMKPLSKNIRDAKRTFSNKEHVIHKSPRRRLSLKILPYIGLLNQKFTVLRNDD